MNNYLIECTYKIDNKDFPLLSSDSIKYSLFIKQKNQNSTLLSLDFNKTEYKFRNFSFSPNGKIISFIDVNSRIFLFNYEEGNYIGEIIVNLDVLKEIDQFISIEKRNFLEKSFSRISFLKILNEVENIMINDDYSFFVMKSKDNNNVYIFKKKYVNGKNNIYGNWFDLNFEIFINFVNIHLSNEKQLSVFQREEIKCIRVTNQGGVEFSQSESILCTTIRNKINFSQNIKIINEDQNTNIIFVSSFIKKIDEKTNELLLIKSQAEFNDNIKEETNDNFNFFKLSYKNNLQLLTNKYYDSTKIITHLSDNCNLLCCCISFICKIISFEIIVYDLTLKIYKTKLLSLSDFNSSTKELEANDIYYSHNQFIINIGFTYLIIFDCYSMDIIYFIDKNGHYSPVLSQNILDGIRINKILFSTFYNGEENEIKYLYIQSKKNQFKIELTRKHQIRKKYNNFLDNESSFLDYISLEFFT